MEVTVQRCSSYESSDVDGALESFRPLFERNIHPGDTVVLKPNWLAHAHKYRPQEWTSIITNPAIISGVLRLVLDALDGSGRVVIADAPLTNSSWIKIMARMEPDRWIAMGRSRGTEVSILDLRDHEWTTRGDVIIARRELPGDPLGSTCADVGPNSEFVGHRPSARGYYGADYNVTETNEAHSGLRHRYKVSRSVISADVVVNIPKMKTHKRAGITCCLKNLVGINTEKNWLPHHNEGTPQEGGDQFPANSRAQTWEGLATEKFKALLWSHPELGKWLVPVKYVGKKLFGDTRTTVRSGNWYGNDTLWRMVLDLNKVLFYSNPDGTLRPDSFANAKRFLAVVDGVIAGEGDGPEAPEPKRAGLLVAGTNPVAVDAACARLMGFDWRRIPSIANAFAIRHYRLCNFEYEEIRVDSADPYLCGVLADIPIDERSRFRPHFGWAGHVELACDEDWKLTEQRQLT